MRHAFNRQWLFGMMSVFILHMGQSFAAEEVFAPQSFDEARGQVLVWAAGQNADQPRMAKLAELWTTPDQPLAADQLHDLVIRSFALLDEDTARLVGQCQSVGVILAAPDAKLLERDGLNPFYKNNLALFYGRVLTERKLFDEAIDQLEPLDPRQTVDPAAVLFYRAVAYQGVLDVKPALESLDKLLHHTQAVPIRYSATGAVLEAELQALQEKSLGETARLMSDSERRLELGRSGQKVQAVQQRIIANLDELIKKLEDCNCNGGGDGNGNNSNQSNSPANDSSVKGKTAPGNTDKKRFENNGVWGNLPEKEQAQAKNLIDRNFPSNYQPAIEAYSKKIANRAAKTDDK